MCALCTDEQVTEGISLHAQQARVTAYALLKAWDKLRRRVQETWGIGDLDR